MVSFRRDQIGFGLLLGLLTPVLSFFGYYQWKFGTYELSEYLFYLRTNRPLVTAITIPCLVLNIALFTYYINTKRDETAKGIFAVTLLYALASLAYKFFG
ncbi:MAG: hypothetical protein FJX89_09945 [Bacteroidetes bacterium]|nr:hypothetical protein [Bacteroidota bacterium]